MLTVVAGCALASLGAHAQVSLGTALDLALRNSDSVKIAFAEAERARASLSETKDAYVPALGISSGLAKGTGFPPGDPSTFKLNATGLIYNAAQPQFVRATRAAWNASKFALENAQQQVVLDAALTYFELDADDREIDTLRQQEAAGADMVRMLNDRVAAGVESQLAVKRTQLRAAQARLRRLDTESRADVVREHLSTLTGITASALRTVAAVPIFPPLPTTDIARHLAVDSSAAIKSAYAEAQSKRYFALGQHKINLRPEVDLLLQYGYLEDFNDYSQYYASALPRNNAVAGVQISIPLLNRAQTAKAREADAEATKATLIANQQGSQVGEQIVQLRRSVEQTEAAADVARLQHDLAVDTLESTKLRAARGGTVNGAVLTPIDTAGAQMDELGLAADAVAAEFEHTRAELQWMRAIGTLNEWARSGATALQP